VGGDDEDKVEIEEKKEKVLEIIELSDISKDDLVASGSSELSDNSGYGFAYDAENVFDMDFSTAWCPKASDVPAELTIDLPDNVTLGNVGIVGGFGRDESIYMQNNRLKTVEVWYDDQPEALEEFNFEDEYEMQFFEMPNEPGKKVTFKIMDVYPGSKYDDTCIAEVDFFNEWVATEDADAAMNYYKEHKAAFAVRPVGVEMLRMTYSPFLTACGQMNTSNLDRIDDGEGPMERSYYQISNNAFLYG